MRPQALGLTAWLASLESRESPQMAFSVLGPALCWETAKCFLCLWHIAFRSFQDLPEAMDPEDSWNAPSLPLSHPHQPCAH